MRPKQTKDVRSRKRKSSRNVLIIVASFFILSALMRLGSGAGPALAREFESLTAPAEPDYCIPTDGLEALVTSLQERERNAEKREAEIAERLATLAIAERVYEENMQDLLAAEEALSQTIAQANSAADEDINKLTALYENMKASESAPLFEQMEPDFAAGFIARMRSETAANILASLPAESAYAISVVLAGRNANIQSE
ncbi:MULTISPECIES: MotE family protein [Halocynthiibacter]|uniref:Magnesium transporter MgtE intracellular domain-containing protein n=1 Tax=Halocynthiibacter halioticoli TaxID=2986804 RepID=A0AAE3IXT9_9RHOB|nr:MULTISPECIES: hypothetical protein [Halocynthiibacter]MCV6823085.1 hypothetical protein [Halocynthiibacter halioticoli]MCW4056086.1 hypothetical protein [Halocynthiibacter sp. SDUM655004]MDE0591343.1 hypothetical protein [Halocynthiibacter sp. C4]